MSESCFNFTKGDVTAFYTMAVSGMCDVMVMDGESVDGEGGGWGQCVNRRRDHQLLIRGIYRTVPAMELLRMSPPQ